MSFLFPSTQRVSLTDVIPAGRSRSTGTSSHVSSGKALTSSAVFQASMIRAEFISAMPVDVFFRYTGADRLTELPAPNVLRNPSRWDDATPMTIADWLYATQRDLDNFGNAFGIITERDGNNLPKRIDLVAAEDVVVRGQGMHVTRYVINGKEHDPADIWHERQFIQAGSPVGLSPIAHAALAINSHLSAMEFTLEWFDRGATPSMIAKHTTKELNDTQSDKIKRRMVASFRNGEPAVVGKDWELTIAASKAKDIAFIEVSNMAIADVARFYNLPLDILNAAIQGQSITYQNITQRNTDLLIRHLTAPVKRREDALSRLVPGGRFVKLNSAALTRMDEYTRRRMLIDEVAAGIRTVDEVRALENLPPLPTTDSEPSDNSGGTP